MENSNKNLNKDGDKTTTTTHLGHGPDQEGGGNEGELLNPFARTSRIARTPPRPRVDSCPELKSPRAKILTPVLDKRKRDEGEPLPPSRTETSVGAGSNADEEVFVVEAPPSPGTTQKAKRKKEMGFFSSNIAGIQFGESEDEAAMTNGLIQLMQKLENMAADLTYQTKKHVNTKVEVKKLAGDIDMVSQALARKLHKFCKTVARKLRKSSGSEGQTSSGAKATKEAASQTDPAPHKQRSRDQEEKRVTEAETDGDILEATKLQWPEEWFKATTTKSGNPWNTLGGEDFAVLLSDREASMDSGIGRLLRDRFPEVARIEGSGSLRVTSTVQLGDEDPVVKLRHIHRVCLSAPTDAGVLTALRTLKSLALRGTGKVVLPTPTGVDGARLRKLADLVFRREGIKAVIHVPQRKGGKISVPLTLRPPSGESRRVRRERNTEVLLVKQGHSSYGDMVKGLKTMVDESQDLKANLKQVRKTQDGRLLIAFEKGDSDAMEKVKRQIVGSWEGVEISGGNRGNKRILHIKGLDDAVEDEEIKEAICGIVPALEKDAVEIGSRRPMYGGNWAATVTVEGGDPQQFPKKTKIRIGFNECVLEERVDITKCFRCWEFGHVARNCKGPDRRSLCNACGQQGHLAAACVNEPHCVLCEKSGHRGGSANCPKFKEALAGKRALMQEKGISPPLDV